MTDDSETEHEETNRRWPSWKRRTVLGAIGAAGIGSVASGQESDDEQQAQPDQPRDDSEESWDPRSADRVFVNGCILTIDEHEINDDPGTLAEEMAVRDGKIIAIGDEGDARQYAGSDTEIVDLGGKTVIPGIVESHVHSQSTVEDLFPERLRPNGVHVGIQGEETPEATLDKFENMIEQVELEEDEWVFAELRENPDAGIETIWQMAQGWIGTEDPADQEITRELLSDILPDNPLSMGVRITDLPEDGQIVRWDREEGEEVLLDGGETA